MVTLKIVPGMVMRLAPDGAMLPICLIGYGTVRFFIDYFRQPDAQIGFVLLALSMGRSIMIIFGIFLNRRLSKRQTKIL